MFGVEQERLAAGLKRMNAGVCGYTRPGALEAAHRCDCKYGIAEEARPNSEQTGCPELRMAALLVAALTPAEFSRACRRAGVEVTGAAPPKAARKGRGR